MRHHMMYITVVVLGIIFLLVAAIFGFMRSFEQLEQNESMSVEQERNLQNETLS